MDMAWPALRSLRELARHGTIGAAAQAQGYTPGAVSQQLATLERAVGRPLLRRVGRRVRLTDAGLILLEHAERILRSEEEARIALEAASDAVVGTLTIATFATSAALLLAPSILTANTRHPRLAIRTLEIDVDAVAHAVESGDADLALGLNYPDVPVRRAAGVDVIPLGGETFSISMAAGADPGGAGRLSLRDFAEHHWILPPEASEYGQAIRSACRRARFEPRVAHVVTDTAVSLAMAAQGLGVTPTTPMMRSLSATGGLRTRGIREDVRRDVVLIRRTIGADRPVVQAMTAILRGVVESAIAAGEPAAMR